YLGSLIPVSITILRKLETFGRADLLVSEETSGYQVRFLGPSADPTGLRVGDVVVLVDGAPAIGAGELSARPARPGAELTLGRDGAVRALKTSPAPAPWDVKYLFLFCVGAAFFMAGASALRQAGAPAFVGAPLLFAGFALTVSLVLMLTPVPRV